MKNFVEECVNNTTDLEDKQEGLTRCDVGGGGLVDGTETDATGLDLGRLEEKQIES